MRDLVLLGCPEVDCTVTWRRGTETGLRKLQSHRLV